MRSGVVRRYGNPSNKWLSTNEGFLLSTSLLLGLKQYLRKLIHALNNITEKVIPSSSREVIRFILSQRQLTSPFQKEEKSPQSKDESLSTARQKLTSSYTVGAGTVRGDTFIILHNIKWGMGKLESPAEHPGSMRSRITNKSRTLIQNFNFINIHFAGKPR